MQPFKKALEYLAGTDFSQRAYRYACCVGEFETDEDQLKYRKRTLRDRMFFACTGTYIVNVWEAINISCLLTDADRLQPRQLTTHLTLGVLLEGMRYLLRRNFDAFERSQYDDLDKFKRSIQGSVNDMRDNRELKRQFADWDKDWKEAASDDDADVA